MNQKRNILLIGHIFVDVCFYGDKIDIRLGGIMHSARALWAIKHPFMLGYFAPGYLDESISSFSRSIGARHIFKIGNVVGCPNVMIVGEPTESGPQRYEHILRDEQKCFLDNHSINKNLGSISELDALIYPGGFNLSKVLSALNSYNASIYIDGNFEPRDIEQIAVLDRPLASYILSTSSFQFEEHRKDQLDHICGLVLGKYAEALLVKENRGGSRLFYAGNKEDPVLVPAQIKRTKHSVGVGDCFNAVFVAMRNEFGDKAALAYASSVAAEYAATTEIDCFGDKIKAIISISPNEIVELKGSLVPWERRPNIHVYIAAPDFTRIATQHIDRLEECLRYHNFTPHRPVREHGEMKRGDSRTRKRELFQADLDLLNKCQILVAVLLYDDPGTLIEIGVAYEKGIPVIVYAPYDEVENIILTHVPKLVSTNLEEVITRVFYEVTELID